MNRQSIFFTITVSFIISIVLVVASFTILMTENYKVEKAQLFEKYMPIIKMVLRKHHEGGLNVNFAKSLENLNYELFLNKGKINAITYNPQTKVLIEKKDRRAKKLFRIIRLNDNNYLYMKKRGKTLLIKDKTSLDTNSNLYIILVFAVVILTIILMYLITIRKLQKRSPVPLVYSMKMRITTSLLTRKEKMTVLNFLPQYSTSLKTGSWERWHTPMKL